MPEIQRKSNLLPVQLRKARKKLGLSQEEFASMIGVTKATISSYESEDEEKRKLPSLERTMAMAEKLRISLDELCGLTASSAHKINGKNWLRALIDGEDLFDGVKQTYKFSIKPDYENECDGWAILEMSSPCVIEFFKAYNAFEPVRQNTEMPKDIAREAMEHMLEKYGKLIDEHGRERPGAPLRTKEEK